MEQLYDDIEIKKMHQAIHYVEINRINQAKDILQDILVHNPHNAEALFYMAICCYSHGQYQDTMNFCNEAFSYGYLPEECNTLMGTTYMSMGRYYEAEVCFLEALRTDPQNARIITKYASLMMETGFEEKAKGLLEEALSIEPKDEYVLKHYFYYHLVQNNKEEQIKILEQYIAVCSNGVMMHANIGLAELYRNNYKKARKAYKEAFLLDPVNVDLLKTLQNLDKQTHILMLPQNIIRKIGGPAVVWIIVMVLMVGLRALHFDKAAFFVVISYIILCVYSWVTPLLVKYFVK